MGIFYILCIITYTNLFRKVDSLEKQLTEKNQIEQEFENALNYLLNYCNNKYDIEDDDHTHVENVLALRYSKNINFTTTICQPLIRHEITPLPGMQIRFYII